MKRIWETDELIATFTLTADEIAWFSGREASTQLGRAIQLKCLEYEGRFPEKAKEVPPAIVQYIAQQLGINPNEYTDYDWTGRTGKTDRVAIRQRLGFRPVQEDDYPELTNWLLQQPILYEDHSIWILVRLGRKYTLSVMNRWTDQVRVNHVFSVQNDIAPSDRADVY